MRHGRRGARRRWCWVRGAEPVSSELGADQRDQRAHPGSVVGRVGRRRPDPQRRACPLASGWWSAHVSSADDEVVVLVTGTSLKTPQSLQPNSDALGIHGSFEEVEALSLGI